MTRGRRPRSNSPAAIAKREKYAADKAAKLATLSEPNIPTETPLDNAGKIDIEVIPNETPKLSLKDRLFGNNLAGAPTKAKTPPKKGQRGKQIDASLMSQMLPTMISGSIALYAQKLIKNPYKPCAPTQKEVFGTVGPLFNILARRIEIVGTASEDMIDLITALLTGLCTGMRMHITYLAIQEEIERQKHDGSNRIASNAPNGLYSHANDNRTEATISPSREASIPIGYGTNGGTNVTDGDADIADGDNLNAKREANLFAEAFKRDRQGRAKLGLLT